MPCGANCYIDTRVHTWVPTTLRALRPPGCLPAVLRPERGRVHSARRHVCCQIWRLLGEGWRGGGSLPRGKWRTPCHECDISGGTGSGGKGSCDLRLRPIVCHLVAAQSLPGAAPWSTSDVWLCSPSCAGRQRTRERRHQEGGAAAARCPRQPQGAGAGFCARRLKAGSQGPSLNYGGWPLATEQST